MFSSSGLGILPPKQGHNPSQEHRSHAMWGFVTSALLAPCTGDPPVHLGELFVKLELFFFFLTF